MTLKTKMSLLLFLTSVSIVSIGFSSWSITAETTAEINGNIKVDNVISLEDCIYFNTEYGTNKMGIDLLRYYDSGFIDKDNYIVNNATMTAYYTVDLMKCKDLFTPLTTMVVDISLKWATPPARTPRDSRRWAWKSCSVRACFSAADLSSSVISCPTRTRSVLSLTRIGVRELSICQGLPESGSRTHLKRMGVSVI